MRLNKKYLIGIYLFFALININAQDNRVRKNNIIVISHSMHYCCIGSGSPTIVQDVGIGETYRDWLPFLNKITNKVQIFFYDRAGYGQSEIGSLPRDSKTEATELKTLLEKTNIKGSYILLGHSLGALNLEVFVSQYANEFAGILLLDPPPLEWISGKGFLKLTRMAEHTTVNFKNFSEKIITSNSEADRQKADFFKTLASEHEEMFLASAKEALAIASFGDVPLIVIASEKANPQMGDDAVPYQKYWDEQCKKLSLKSTKGEYLLAAKNSHHIHIDNPEIVMDAINKLLSK